MAWRPFIALPILLALSGCNENMETPDPPAKPQDEIKMGEANELSDTPGQAESNIELRDPVGLD